MLDLDLKVMKHTQVVFVNRRGSSNGYESIYRLVSVRASQKSKVDKKKKTCHWTRGVKDGMLKKGFLQGLMLP